MTAIGGWVNDLAMGVRLAVGGGRTAMVRVVLAALGIAIAVTVLLVATCVGTMSENRAARSVATLPNADLDAGSTPTYLARRQSEFHGEYVLINYVWSPGRDAPKPDALPALPKPGEMYVSPALAELLGSDEGSLLRPRLPHRTVGVLDKELVVDPGTLEAWVGADHTLADSVYVEEAYGFGDRSTLYGADPGMLSLILIGAVLLLLPVLIFVTSASRVAGAERDRRLSALRLVGAGRWQVRRIAAAESLVSAVLGMAAGGVIFAVGRLYVEDLDMFGESAYTSDMVPDPVLAVVVLALIPALSVLTALFALRRTIIEPLGVLRQSKPIRRRAWWRFAVAALGVLLLITQGGADARTDNAAIMLAAGTGLTLIGMVVLLPWLLERVANRITGGPPSWMLAVRRLQLDSGTSSRVVGGVAVVLAGMITMQTVLLSLGGALAMPSTRDAMQGIVEVHSDTPLAADIQRSLSGTPGVLSASTLRDTSAYDADRPENGFGFTVADCAAMKALGGVRTCQDGDVFAMDSKYQTPPAPGTRLEFREYPDHAADWDPDDYTVTGTWTIPDHVVTLPEDEQSPLHGSLYVTPGAIPNDVVPSGSSTVMAKISDTVTSDELEGVRNTLAEFGWQATYYSYNTAPELSADQQTFASIRTALYAGSIFTLALAGVTMLVMAAEHIRERRRPLAMLAASGVPRAVLGRSILWQVALPIGLGVIMALITGIGLAAMMLHVAGDPMTVDWSGITLMCTGAAALSLLVNALTLPFLKRAMRLNTIRTE